MKYFIPLEPENYYHIFNRAIGNEKLFLNESNYHYFLKKFKEYSIPIANVYSYVLMPNHFHFLIEIKSKKEIYDRFRSLEMTKEKTVIVLEKDFDAQKFVMQQFSNFFNCYTKSFNTKYSRKGALFIDYLKRTLISSDDYLKNIVLYIHQNPIHHKYCNRLEDWTFSSYNSILSNKVSSLNRIEVLDWFGNIENFIFEHTVLKNLDYEY